MSVASVKGNGQEKVSKKLSTSIGGEKDKIKKVRITDVNGLSTVVPILE